MGILGRDWLRGIGFLVWRKCPKIWLWWWHTISHCFQVPCCTDWHMPHGWGQRCSASLSIGRHTSWHVVSEAGGASEWHFFPGVSGGLKFILKQLSKKISSTGITNNTEPIWLREKQKLWLPRYLKILEALCKMCSLSSKGRLIMCK